MVKAAYNAGGRVSCQERAASCIPTITCLASAGTALKLPRPKGLRAALLQQRRNRVADDILSALHGDDAAVLRHTDAVDAGVG